MKNINEFISKYWQSSVLICRQTHYQVVRDKIKAKSFVQNNCMLMVNFIKGK